MIPSRIEPRRRVPRRSGLRRVLALALLWMLGCQGDPPPSTGPGAARGRAERSPAGASAPPIDAASPRVVLISMDGTRPADLIPERLPSLVRLAERGVRAEGLVPVNPSNTFPSHVSLVTGVAPEEHRIVNNRFIDPERGEFERGEAHAWIEAEPIWSIAERQGMPTASYYWVGSEGPWTGGPGPREHRAFSSRTTEKTKVNRILKWLAEPDPERRPRLITSWFHGADHAGHTTGPGSEAVVSSLAPQDREIDRLIREMEAAGHFANTTLIFVSDHGMTTAERRVQLGSLLGRARLGLSVRGIGGFASVVFDPGRKSQKSVARVLSIARGAGLEAYPRANAPRSWQVGDPRFGDVVVRAPIGTAIVTPFMTLKGFHGYDAREPEMAGILVAYGRGVAGAGKRSHLGSPSSLSVAPTVLRLLGLPVPAAMRAPVIDALLVGVEEGVGAGQRGR